MSAKNLTITMAQLNPTVGDIDGNIQKILDVYKKHKTTSDIIAYTETVVTGYPTDDLVLKPFFIDKVMEAVKGLSQQIDGDGAGILISAPWRHEGRIYNTAILIHNHEIKAERYKHRLPNYGVFDEVRVFSAGPLPDIVTFKGAQLGILTCEDMWFPDVTGHLKEKGAEIFIIPNGSPYEVEKHPLRLTQAEKRIDETGIPIVYINQIGGQDELVFDGASFVMDHHKKVLTQLPSHIEYVSTTIWEKEETDKIWTCKSCEARQPIYVGLEEIYQSLVLGVRDYVNKNGFPGVLFGMSGGVDSALTAAIAVDALGADRVKCYMMPSPYTSNESIEDAQQCADLLGIEHGVIPIEPSMKAFDQMLSQSAGQDVTGITAENIQARTRGMIIMAMSNATGAMVLSTGNKSEMSVGYATLYGDMCGGFNPLKDVYKMTVFNLCHWRNQNEAKNGLGPKGRVIPERIITKPPSAELRPDQKDEDSLPPYAALDDILQSLVEHEMNIADIVARGHDVETVNKVWKLLDRAEYKRRQACPGVKITAKAFGRDRRYPITNKFTSIT